MVSKAKCYHYWQGTRPYIQYITNSFTASTICATKISSFWTTQTIPPPWTSYTWLPTPSTKLKKQIAQRYDKDISVVEIIDKDHWALDPNAMPEQACGYRITTFVVRRKVIQLDYFSLSVNSYTKPMFDSIYPDYFSSVLLLTINI